MYRRIRRERRIGITSRILILLSMLLVPALVALSAANPARAEVIDCRTLWAEPISHWGSWSGGGGFSCEEYVPDDPDMFDPFGVEVKIFIPDWWSVSPHPEAPENTPEIIARALHESLTAMAPFLDPMPINAVLLDTVRDQSETGNWNWRTQATALDRDPCPVSVFLPGVTGKTADELTGIIGHEVFHCFQYEHYRDQARAALRGDGNGRWWLEGTAKQFEGALRPCSRFARFWPAEYDTDTEVIAQRKGYPASLLFHYLAKNEGYTVRQFAQFMAAMSTSETAARQRRALAGAPAFDPLFHGFGRAIVNGGVPTGCGDGKYEVAFDSDDYEVDESRRIEIDLEAFKIESYGVQIPSDKVFDVRVEAGGGGDWRMSYRPADDPEGWTEIAAGSEIRISSCDKSESFIFLPTSTDHNQRRIELDLVLEEKDDGSVPESLLCGTCPVGLWRADIPYLNDKVAGIGAYVGGNIFLRLDEDGAAEARYVNLTDEHGIRYQGTSSGRWKKVGMLEMPLPREGQVGEALERLGIESTADLPQPDDIILVEWTNPGVTETWETSAFRQVETGKNGPHAPVGRNHFRCEGDNDELYLTGLRYERVR